MESVSFVNIDAIAILQHCKHSDGTFAVSNGCTSRNVISKLASTLVLVSTTLVLVPMTVGTGLLLVNIVQR